MKFTAAGDALLQQRVPENYEGFAEVRDFIGRGDARFFNLETTLNHEGETYASQFSGGTYIRTDPEIGEYLAGMCAPYGTKITPNDDGTLSCSW